MLGFRAAERPWLCWLIVPAFVPHRVACVGAAAILVTLDSYKGLRERTETIKSF